MPHFRSIRSRRKRKSLHKKEIELPLTSMMDILVIILVFLLKSYAASNSTFVGAEGAELPYSRSENIPPDSHEVVITRDYIAFEDEKLLYFLNDGATPGQAQPGAQGQAGAQAADAGQFALKFKKEDLDEGGRRILPLYDALTQAREKSELLRAKSAARTENGEPLPFSGILAIQADKHVSYDVLRRVMYTAATAGYRVYRFLALRHEE